MIHSPRSSTQVSLGSSTPQASSVWPLGSAGKLGLESMCELDTRSLDPVAAGAAAHAGQPLPQAVLTQEPAVGAAQRRRITIVAGQSKGGQGRVGHGNGLHRLLVVLGLCLAV